MHLSLRIISSPENESVNQWETIFPDNGGTIGKVSNATLQLNDQQNSISDLHATIRKTSSGYQIEDSSEHGTYINNNDYPLGKGCFSILCDGDVLSIGNYRILVSCFDPSTAQAQIDPQTTQQRLYFFDDPFEQTNNTAHQEQPPSSLINADEELIKNNDPLYTIEEDPFNSESDHITSEIKTIDFDFHHEDEEDSFSNQGSNAEFLHFNEEHCNDKYNESDITNEHSLSNKILPQPTPAPSIVPVLMRNNENPKNIKRTDNITISQINSSHSHHANYYTDDIIDRAIEVALSQLINELSPEKLEPMFHKVTNRWNKKSAYWDLYKNYYSHQVDSNDWKVKFRSYFYEFIRYQNKIDRQIK